MSNMLTMDRGLDLYRSGMAKTQPRQENLPAAATDDLLLVTMDFDDSQSISEFWNAGPIRTAYDIYLNKLLAHPNADNILLRLRFLNDPWDDRQTPEGQRRLIESYRPLRDAVRLTRNNYSPRGGTPLYDSVFDTFASVVWASRWFRHNRKVRVNTVTYAITDGEDAQSQRKSAQDVLAAHTRMMQANRHLILGVGVYNGRMRVTQEEPRPFAPVFNGIGIFDPYILEIKGDAASIEREFGETCSRTTSRAADDFYETRDTGFVGSRDEDDPALPG